MPTTDREFDYQVCYGVGDRVTFANGTWLGPDIPESERKQEDIQKCPLMWEYLNRAGADGWELVTIHETPAARGNLIRTYFLKRER